MNNRIQNSVQIENKPDFIKTENLHMQFKTGKSVHTINNDKNKTTKIALDGLPSIYFYDVGHQLQHLNKLFFFTWHLTERG